MDMYKLVLFMSFIYCSIENTGPSDYDTQYQSVTLNYEYTGDVTRIALFMTLSSDQKYMYLIEQGTFVGSSNIILSKRDLNFNVEWCKTYLINDGAIGLAVDSTDTSIYLISYTSPGILAKFSTIDGSLSWAKSIPTSISSGRYPRLSPDEKYLSFSGVSSTQGVLIEYRFTTQSIEMTITHNAYDLKDIIPFKNEQIERGLLVLTFSYGTIYDQYDIFAVDLSDKNSPLKWSKSVEGTTSCSDNAALGYVDESASSAVISANLRERAMLFQLSTTDGSVQSLLYESDFIYTNIEIQSIGGLNTIDSDVFIYYKHDSGYIAFTWSISEMKTMSTFGTIYGTIGANYITASDNGFLFLSITPTDPQVSLSKIYYDDFNSRFSFLTGISSISSTTDFIYSENVLLMINLNAVPVFLSDSTFSVIDPSGYTINSLTVNDLVYLGGNNIELQATSGKIMQIGFDYLCSRSGANTISVSIFDVDSTLPVSSWISTDNNFEYLNIDATSIDMGIYEFGLKYITGSNIVKVYGQIEIVASSDETSVDK